MGKINAAVEDRNDDIGAALRRLPCLYRVNISAFLSPVLTDVVKSPLIGELRIIRMREKRRPVDKIVKRSFLNGIVELYLVIRFGVLNLVTHCRILGHNRVRIGIIEIIDNREAVDRFDLIHQPVMIRERDLAYLVERNPGFESHKNFGRARSGVSNILFFDTTQWIVCRAMQARTPAIDLPYNCGDRDQNNRQTNVDPDVIAIHLCTTPKELMTL